MSKIEWTDCTLNPIRARDVKTGKRGWHCEHVSEGCRNCYAEKMNRWRGTGAPFAPVALRGGFPGHGPPPRTEVFLDEKTLLQPLSWRKPRRCFIGDMTDIFGPWVPDEWLDRIFAMMALTPHITWQVLTKRPERAREYFRRNNLAEAWWEAGDEMSSRLGMTEHHPGAYLDAAEGKTPLPLPNVWLGTSVEDQATADARIPLLLDTPAAVRFVSYEPALGPVDFSPWIDHPYHDSTGGAPGLRMCAKCGDIESAVQHRPGGGSPKTGLDWIICGGESGPGARPMHPDWARAVRDQCAAAGAAFFLKQLSSGGSKPIKDISQFPEDLQIREFPNDEG